MRPRSHSAARCTRMLSLTLTLSRFLGCKVGSVMLWSAIYDMFDLFVGAANMERAYIFIVSGLVGVLVIDGRLDTFVYVYTESSYNIKSVTWQSSLWQKAVAVVRATLALLFQVCVCVCVCDVM
jgi:hypothetical protein